MTTPTRRQLAEYAAKQIIDGASPKKVARELAAVLFETGRTKEAELLTKDIAWELERRGIQTEAEVTTATPLSDDIRRELVKFIKNKTGTDKVTLAEQIDRDVIGGVKIETALSSWDKTLSRALKDIREAF